MEPNQREKFFQSSYERDRIVKVVCYVLKTLVVVVNGSKMVRMFINL